MVDPDRPDLATAVYQPADRIVHVTGGQLRRQRVISCCRLPRDCPTGQRSTNGQTEGGGDSEDQSNGQGSVKNAALGLRAAGPAVLNGRDR